MNSDDKRAFDAMLAEVDDSESDDEIDLPGRQQKSHQYSSGRVSHARPGKTGAASSGGSGGPSAVAQAKISAAGSRRQGATP